MDGQAGRTGSSREREPVTAYEPPRVERVLSPAELEREVLYAGAAAPSADT